MGDWTSVTYIVSQIFVIAGYALLAGTYFVKRRWKLLAVAMASNAMMAVGFGFLSAWVGVATLSLALVRDTVNLILNAKRGEANKKIITKLDWWLLALWVASWTAVTAFTAEKFGDWFGYFASLTFTVAIWQKNKVVYNFMGPLISAFWITYHFIVDNFFGVVLESVLLAFIITGAVLSAVKPKQEQSKPHAQLQPDKVYQPDQHQAGAGNDIAGLM